MRAWLAGWLLLLIAWPVQAAWLRYDNATGLITGYHPTIQMESLPGQTVVEGTFAFPAVDGCAGRPEWSRVTQVSPLTVGLLTGVRCVNGEDVPDFTVADAERLALQRAICTARTPAQLDTALPDNATDPQHITAQKQWMLCVNIHLTRLRRLIGQ